MRELREALDALLARQRQGVEASHLSGLLAVVMSSSAETLPPVRPPQRSNTILPGPNPDVSVSELEGEPVPSSGAYIARHSWDAAVESARQSQPPPLHAEGARGRRAPPPAWSVDELPPDSGWGDEDGGSNPTTATESFEEGLAQLRLGDLTAAEAAWLRALELDPSHRLSQVNLKLLRKRRESERPEGTG
jgi:hypothetical protein